MSEMFSRRSFLKLSGALAAASALAACSGGGSSGGSTSGNGGSSGGDSSGGGSSYDSNEYYDIDGLKMKRPSSSGATSGKFYLGLRFKNNTGSDITISKNDFIQASFDNTPTTVLGFDKSLSDSFKITSNTDQSQSTYVPVYFDVSNLSSNQEHKFSFKLKHNNKTAVCTGTYTPMPTPLGDAGTIIAYVTVS